MFLFLCKYFPSTRRYFHKDPLGWVSKSNRGQEQDVAYPLLLELYHDYKSGILLKSDFISLIRLIEGYVFRRAVCKIPTNSMNKTFATFAKSIQKEGYLESAKAHFLLLPSYRRYPNDDEFKKDIQTRDLYNFRSRSYWLRRIENHDRKERVSVDEYTIEHILPQNENLSEAWKDSLGDNWESVHQTWLHTLGNLTLTGYNSEYSDRPFKEKRDMKGGFKESPLKVNAGLGSIENWNADSIQERAKSLAEIALKVWVAPTLSGEVLQKYKIKPESKSTYTIADHAHLSGEPVLELFNAFRSEVQRLDPCVSEEFLKLYVAYKAETNFVDVIPLSKRLRLTLNMPFSELIDPKNIARDIAGLGRWGNGDVEVNLSELSELPYVLGLVRQALDRQLEDGT